MSELLSPQKRVLVIGGGVAGLTAALELSRMGVDTRLVENGVFPGGHGAYLACKATDRCLKCNGC
ncbi:MAG: FAD-dependent oxidoreductase, partial [Deltaproteobacteria bacterium]|nr:FAD-dependent oxidoreductase [Deltaproteobacteria bacterium]